MTTDQLVKALEETWEGLHKVLAGIGDDEWGLPTPCTEWDVHDLAAHLGAIESQFQGMPQPPTEAPPPTAGIDAWTAAGVVARRAWTPDEIRREAEAASEAQLDDLRSLDAEGWQSETVGPLGPTTKQGLATIRVLDLYLHLLDLRTALGRSLDVEGAPAALATCVEQVVTLTPWGAVKRAGLGDGARVRLDLSDPSGQQADLVVEGGRGRLDPPGDGTTQSVTGPAAAYLLAVTGRDAMAEAAGGVTADGDDAQRLLAGYRFFG